MPMKHMRTHRNAWNLLLHLECYLANVGSCRGIQYSGCIVPPKLGREQIFPLLQPFSQLVQEFEQELTGLLLLNKAPLSVTALCDVRTS
jgi:hypothetical protein